MEPGQRLTAKFAGGGVLLLVIGGGLYTCSSGDEGRAACTADLREGCQAAGHDPTAGNSAYPRCMEVAKSRCTAEAPAARTACAKQVGVELSAAH